MKYLIFLFLPILLACNEKTADMSADVQEVEQTEVVKSAQEIDAEIQQSLAKIDSTLNEMTNTLKELK
ncbi:MAG: hypothetical protein RL226_3 [Bacteroidota bacterium]|jgi:L-rhamnose mutarotase